MKLVIKVKAILYLSLALFFGGCMVNEARKMEDPGETCRHLGLPSTGGEVVGYYARDFSWIRIILSHNAFARYRSRLLAEYNYSKSSARGNAEHLLTFLPELDWIPDGYNYTSGYTSEKADVALFESAMDVILIYSIK